MMARPMAPAYVKCMNDMLRYTILCYLILCYVMIGYTMYKRYIYDGIMSRWVKNPRACSLRVRISPGGRGHLGLVQVATFNFSFEL